MRTTTTTCWASSFAAAAAVVAVVWDSFDGTRWGASLLSSWGVWGESCGSSWARGTSRSFHPWAACCVWPPARWSCSARAERCAHRGTWCNSTSAARACACSALCDAAAAGEDGNNDEGWRMQRWPTTTTTTSGSSARASERKASRWSTDGYRTCGFRWDVRPLLARTILAESFTNSNANRMMLI